MKYYDLENNLVTVSNSLLKHFNCPTFHNTCKELDKILANTNKRICVILFDGFGGLVQERHKEFCPYILNNKKIEITSIFPPTTAAATISFLTGKYPVETGWLGWNQKFRRWKDLYTMFMSTAAKDRVTPSPVPINEYVKVKFIDEIMREFNKDKKIEQFKSFDLEENTVNAFFNKTNELCKKDDFLYAYFTNPDHLLHLNGEKSSEVNNCIKEIDQGLEKLVNENKDVLFITLADHGHIDTTDLDIREHQDFYELLKYPFFALEARAGVFYVKHRNKKKFYELANKYYGEYFDIYTKKEVKDLKIFGIGKAHKYFNYCIGDFLFIAKSNKCLFQEFGPIMKSQHAGGTEIERKINLAIFNE